MLKASCLCGGIQFRIGEVLRDISICHCSLCRKVSGAGSLATIAVATANLVWVKGEDLITRFERPTGYGSAFCRICGSPAPDPDSRKTRYAVPMGLLDGKPELGVREHIFVGSKAAWDAIGDNAPQFDTMDADPPESSG